MRKPFAESLRDLRGGAVLDEAAEKLAALIEAVTSEGREGSLTLKLTVKPMERAAGMFVVSDDITLKAPKSKSPGTVVFGTPENNWSRRNPNQDELPGIAPAPSATKKEATNG